ncbi:MAG: hypothetical protein HC849_01050 [Oscillatoriales cyanobacterium RU_3_3]|nr:hypothetical protein [Oscillatoriales cyanobacterium RU_3_3]
MQCHNSASHNSEGSGKGEIEPTGIHSWRQLSTLAGSSSPHKFNLTVLYRNQTKLTQVGEFVHV